MAFDFYFGHGVGELYPSLDEADFERFMEWFVHDYPMSNGHRLIEVFDLEFGAELSAASRRLLRRWRQAHLTVLEAIEGEGEWWRTVDLLTGKVLEPVRVPGDPPRRWSLIVGRPLPVGDGYELSGAHTILPAGVKSSLLDHLRGEFRRYRREYADASLESFLRENGHYFNDLLHEMKDEIAAAELGEEADYRVVHSQAVFEASDTAGVIARLLTFDDIVQIRPGKLIWRDGDGQTVAHISCARGRLQVHCWSREGLEACKRRLELRLDGMARHLLDAYQDAAPVVPGCFSGGLAVPGGAWSGQAHRADESGPRGAGRSAEGQPSITSRTGDTRRAGDAAQACEQFIRNWLERPHVALGGSSPSRLASTELGKARVAELLKQMEHRHTARFGERSQAAVGELRRRLGLDDAAGLVVPLSQEPPVWNREVERAVIGELIRFGGEELTTEHLDSALWMWWNYCSYTTAPIRKPRLWAAALLACVAFVEGWSMTHEEIAARFGVSPASVTKNSWRIVDRLGLKVFDPRYCIFQRIFQGGISGSVAGAKWNDARDPGRSIDDGLWQRLAAADRLRERLARVVDSQPVLRQRAYAFYSSHIGSRRAAKWEEAFLDWYHFDWRVPVMGGRTLVQVALESGAFSGEEHEMLAGWADCHPSFYVVKGVEHGAAKNGRLRKVTRLTLVDLVDARVVAVDWLRLSNPVVPGDVVFARILPVGGAVVSLGPVLDFPPRCKEIFQQALLEDWALVERWNGARLTWDEFRARYAERLYALALQSIAEVDLDLYDD